MKKKKIFNILCAVLLISSLIVIPAFATDFNKSIIDEEIGALSIESGKNGDMYLPHDINYLSKINENDEEIVPIISDFQVEEYIIETKNDESILTYNGNKEKKILQQ